jgi:hypothetical protein
MSEDEGHVLRLSMGTANINLNYLDIARVVNQPPVADAGPDQRVENNSLVTLDGRVSRDPDNGPQSLIYSWTCINGQATLTNPNSATPTFTAIYSSFWWSPAFELRVFDGEKTSVDTVVVSMYGGDNVFLGKVEAEEYLNAYDVTPGNTGGAYRKGDVDIQTCSDAGGGFNIGYTEPGEWVEYSFPFTSAGTYRLTLRVASAATGTKSMTVQIDDAAGSRQKPVAFTYADGWQTWHDVSVDMSVVAVSRGMTMRISFNSRNINFNAVDIVPVSNNQAPIADAGIDWSTDLGGTIRLDGTGTYDPDNGPQPMQIGWKQIGGPAVTLSDITSLIPLFTPTVAGVYQFRLRIYDGEAESLDTVTITLRSSNLLINGDFSDGTVNWTTLYNTPATGGFVVEDVDANPAGRMTITNAGAEIWHIQLRQVITLTLGKTYTFDFDIRGEAANKQFIVFCEENGLDYTVYATQTSTITAGANSWQHFTMSWTQPETKSAKIGWKLGTFNTNDVWIDNAVLKSN